MSSKSNIYCCVPGCTQKGTVDTEGNRVGFFGLPNDQTLRQLELTLPVPLPADSPAMYFDDLSRNLGFIFTTTHLCKYQASVISCLSIQNFIFTKAKPRSISYSNTQTQ